MAAPQAPQNRYGLLWLAAIFFGISVMALMLFGLLDGGYDLSGGNLYLWPWILFVLVVVASPLVYLTLRNRFDFFHPVVFAAWTYFLPAFVLGSIFLATGLSEPSFIHLIPDQRYYLPLTLVYVALGYAGLTFGCAMPWAKRIGVALSRRVPAWDWKPADLLFPCSLLLIIGQLFSFSAFSAGVIGYQRVEAVETFNATLSSLATFVAMASFLLWFAIFRAPRWTFYYKVATFLLITTIIISTIMAGSRGGLLHNLLPIGLAYWMAGRRIKPRHGAAFGLLLVVALFAGMIYGTTFRYVKGTEDQISLDRYLNASTTALEIIGDRSLMDNISFGFAQISERFETTSSLAVVVANHEKLKPFEDDYGLANNIWTYTWTAFIPRFVWPDKPLISDARAYSALYFDFGDSSFALTPIGDLLRNFGPYGIPLGMALLGFVLRILYSALIEGQVITAWRAVAYYMLLGSTSYESFYGNILPGMMRIGVIILLGGLMINALVRRRAA